MGSAFCCCCNDDPRGAPVSKNGVVAALHVHPALHDAPSSRRLTTSLSAAISMERPPLPMQGHDRNHSTHRDGGSGMQHAARLNPLIAASRPHEDDDDDDDAVMSIGIRDQRIPPRALPLGRNGDASAPPRFVVPSSMMDRGGAALDNMELNAECLELTEGTSRGGRPLPATVVGEVCLADVGSEEAAGSLTTDDEGSLLHYRSGGPGAFRLATFDSIRTAHSRRGLRALETPVDAALRSGNETIASKPEDPNQSNCAHANSSRATLHTFDDSSGEASASSKAAGPPMLLVVDPISLGPAFPAPPPLPPPPLQLVSSSSTRRRIVLRHSPPHQNPLEADDEMAIFDPSLITSGEIPQRSTAPSSISMLATVS